MKRFVALVLTLITFAVPAFAVSYPSGGGGNWSVGGGWGAHQPYDIGMFRKGVNDGVYSLTDEQALILGAPDASYVGIYSPGLTKQESRWITPGSSFDFDSVMASVKHNSAPILGILNGINADLDYEGAPLAAFQSATLDSVDRMFPDALFVLFDEGKVRLRDGVKFAANQVNGTFEEALAARGISLSSVLPSETPAQVPLPGAAALMLGGVATLGALRLRRTRKSD